MACSVIAIDGPAGVGKTTIAKKLSKKMNAPVLFSGQLYRAVAYEIVKNKINLSQENKIIQIAKQLDMSIYSERILYTAKIDLISSKISSNRLLRKALINYQRNFPKIQKKRIKHVIIEGRDIGTIIFPKAKAKFFMWASSKIRAKRRYDQVKKTTKKAKLSIIHKEIEKRDLRDMNRKIAPMIPAADSHLIDNTNCDIPQTFNAILKILNEKN
jgi:cytidylate kinase